MSKNSTKFTNIVTHKLSDSEELPCGEMLLHWLQNRVMTAKNTVLLPQHPEEIIDFNDRPF